MFLVDLPEYVANPREILSLATLRAALPRNPSGKILKRVLRALSAGRALILFPEGTRSPDGQLQAPKPGVGFIVCKAQVPVVPVRIFGSFEAYGRGAKLPRFGTRVSIVFGQPITPADYDDPAAGKERYQVASARIMAWSPFMSACISIWAISSLVMPFSIHRCVSWASSSGRE